MGMKRKTRAAGMMLLVMLLAILIPSGAWAEEVQEDITPNAKAAILYETTTGTVLYEKNADQKMYPASTTKIMTALIVLETLEALELGPNSEIVVPAEAQGVEGSSLYLKEGERVSVEELLYGLMLQSGNDSAVALAACVGGSVEHFVERMNQRAAELGCRGTQFVNPNGL